MNTVLFIQRRISRFAATLSRPWKIAATTAALAAIAGHLAQSAAPPAGTSIGNQASATYTDSSNTQRTATSNVAITIVQQVSSFTLTTDGQAKFAGPGGQVFYPHTLLNTGNGTDTFNLSSANAGSDSFDLTSLVLYADVNGDGQPDNSTPITSSGPLAAGASFRFVAVGVVPGSAATNDTGVITVSASGTATATPAPVQTNTDTTTVTGNGVVNVTKAIDSNSGPSGSGPHTFTLTYTNTGNSTATAVTLSDVIPTGMNLVADSGRWSVTGTTVLTDASDGTVGTPPDTIDYSYNAGSRLVTAIIGRVQPGESRTVTFRVNIAAAQPAGLIQNTATYAYDDGSGTVRGPYNTNAVDFTVTQTGSVSITSDTVASAPQGGTVTFTNVVTNTGNGTDSFDITVANSTFPSGTTFQLFKSDGNTPLVDTNGTSTPDTGSLAPAGTYSVVVKAILPPGFAGLNVNYTANVTATSKVNPAGAGVAVGTDVLTSVTSSTVDLTNTAPLPGAPGAGAGPEVAAVVTNTTNPNTTTRFTLYVNNTSAIADTFDLAASTVAGFGSLTVPAGWSVVFRDASNAVITNTGVIGPGGNKLVYADVVIPAGQIPGTTDIYFRALSPTTAAQDRIHDAVTVNTIRSIALTPNNTGQVFSGGTVVYTHILTNNGNVIEGNGLASAIALATADSAGSWSSLVYYDANGNGLIDGGEVVVTDTSFVSNGGAGLAPGETVRLLVKVSAPPGAIAGTSNATTLTATTTVGSYAVAAPAVVTATDNTTVIAGYLVLTKKQALDLNLDGNPDGAYATADLSTGAVPGKAIRYEITVTNTGSAAADNVIVYDSTPAFTTYTTTGPAAVTGGSAPAVTTVPANGATGPLQFNVGTLQPGESAVVTFGVKIDA